MLCNIKIRYFLGFIILSLIYLNYPYFSASCDTLLLFYYILDMGIVGTFIRSKSESCEPYWYRILYPYLLHPLKNIALTSSIFTVVAISAERHRAIVDPLNHRPTFWPYLFWVIVISGTYLLIV
jgi:hypothetical protein